MDLEEGQEVWVRAIVTGDGIPWKKYEDGSSSWFVRIDDHYGAKSSFSVTVMDTDICTPEMLIDNALNDNKRLKNIEEKLETANREEAIWHGKYHGNIKKDIEELFHEIDELKEKDRIQCDVNTDVDGRLSTLEQDLEFADTRALDAQERVAALEEDNATADEQGEFLRMQGVIKSHDKEINHLNNKTADYQQLIDRICQLEREIETHNEVITGLQDEWKRQHGDFDAAMEPPTDRYSLCRVCDKPIGYGQLYCYDHAPLIRTGEAMISADEQKRGSENPKDLPKVINTMDDL